MHTFRKVNNLLKQNDLFGQNIQINFGSYLYKNEKGDPKYKTSIGGFISIFCQTFYCYFFYFFLIQLITNSNNAVSQNDLFVNW